MRYRVIAVDLLGHGQSDKPRGDYSLGRLRGVAARLPRRLEHSRGHGGRPLVRRRGGPAVRPPAQGILPSAGTDQQRRPRPRSGPAVADAVAARCRTRAAADRIPAGGQGRQAALRKRALSSGREVTRYSETLQGPGRRCRTGTVCAAFLRTLRSVVDHRGQAVCAMDRLGVQTCRR